MTIAVILGWALFTIALVLAGNRGGVLLILSRAIDNTRAAIRCAGMAVGAARGEWVRNWESCVHWAQREMVDFRERLERRLNGG
jgi:hypothetical protein